MNSITKRIGLFSLALLLLAGNVLHYPFYAFALGKVKNEMKRELLGISPADERTMDLYLANAVFEKALVDEHEICLDNKWYDIVSVTRAADGHVTIKCLADSHENLLHAWMAKVTKENSDQSAPSKNGKQAVASVSSDYVTESRTTLPVNFTSVSLSFFEMQPGPRSGHALLPELPPRA